MGGSPTRPAAGRSLFEWLPPWGPAQRGPVWPKCGSEVRSGWHGGRGVDGLTRWPCDFGLVILLFQKVTRGERGRKASR